MCFRGIDVAQFTPLYFAGLCSGFCFSIWLYTQLKLKPHTIILALLMAIQTIYCWYCFYQARFLEYDYNYGLLIHGFFISLVALVTLLIVWFRNRQILKKSIALVIAWLVFGSPITFVICSLFYEAIFGARLMG